MLLFGNLTYAYDPSGQRISVGGSLARTDLPEDNQSTTDAANRLTGFNNQALTYDANGNLTGDGINTYTWNARNQLIQMTGAVNAGFTYDATGRRKSKTVNGQTTNYLYDGDNILQEQTGTSLKAGYLMGGIDEIFTRQTPSQTYNYLTDALGSVIRLTDNTGNKLVDYTYDPYGNTAADAVIDNPFQYTGRENDNTGLYYYRARYYSPTYQRFISEDPIGLAGGINVYAYVGGDPISFTDPYGLKKLPVDPKIPLPDCSDITKDCGTCFLCCSKDRSPLDQGFCRAACAHKDPDCPRWPPPEPEKPKPDDPKGCSEENE